MTSGSFYTIKTPESVDVYRPDFLFLGWNSQPDGSGTAFSPGQVITITGNQTLYAQWTQIPGQTVSITYNANMGIGGSTEPSVPAGSSYTVKGAAAAGVSRQNYNFVTWNTAADGSGSSYAPGQVIVPVTDMTLYARWEPQAVTAEIVYGANGGVGGSIDSAVVGSNYTVKSPASANVSNAAGNFIAWNTMPDGTGVNYAPGQVIVPVTGMELYAQWESQDVVVEITYEPNGGDGDQFVDSAVVGSEYTFKRPADVGISRAAATFEEWKTDPDGNGDSYAPGEIITVTGDLTVYAIWQLHN